MKSVTWLSLLGVMTAVGALVACSDEGETGSGGSSAASTTTAATTTADTTTSTSTSSAGGDGATSTGGGGGMGGMGGMGAGGMGGMGATTGQGGGSAAVTLNGCSSDTAEEHLDADVQIDFPSGGLKYAPACLKLTKGHTVTFKGNFASHPLVGGTVEGGLATPDPASPIPATSVGSDPLPVTFSEEGNYGYYCNFHYASGMKGAIFVVP